MKKLINVSGGATYAQFFVVFETSLFFYETKTTKTLQLEATYANLFINLVTSFFGDFFQL